MKLNKATLILALSFVLLLGLLLKVVIFSPSVSQQTSTNKIKVVTSFYPLYYFVSEVGKDLIEVKNITPSGAEPHDYEPTPQDLASIETSRLLVLNGAGLESWGERIKEQVRGQNVTVVSVAENSASKNLEENGKLTRDPHVWLDPVLAMTEVDSITSALITIDPAHQTLYRQNADTLKGKLTDLDNTYMKGLQSCSQKDFVTSHEAFGYLATRYHLNQIAISGISPDEEPSAARLVEISKLVKEKSISYIFFESLVSPKLSETIASETGAHSAVLDPIEGIAAGSGNDYFAVMKMNLENLRLSLQCK